MGFSVSGATAIILVGGIIAFSFAFTAASNGFEQLSDAQTDRENRLLDQQNTAVEIASATYDGDAETLEVVVSNSGSSDLAIARTSLVVDGTYHTDVSSAVDGDDATTLWLSGEQLTLEVSVDAQPDRVKVVTETGVADATSEVTASG